MLALAAPGLGRQGRLPVPLQRAGDKAVVRVDRFVAPACECDLVVRPFQALRPVPLQCCPLQLEILGQLQATSIAEGAGRPASAR